MSKFSFKPSGYQMQDVGDEKQEKPFVRDESGNKIFKKYSVSDITDHITDDCIAYYDADTLYHQAATNQQVKFIIVKHKTEGWEEELAGVKVFRGLGKGIKKDSWLGRKNLEREVEGLPPYNLEDFEIEDGLRLKGEREKCLESAKVQIHRKLKRIRQQFRIPKIVTVIGSGDNFRHELDLCRPYKGERKKTLKPILAEELREWGVKELGAIVTPRSPKYGVIETDDYVDMKGFEGMIHYMRHGKFNKIAILSDKDGYNAPKLLCNPDTYNKDHPQGGKFKYPEAVIVPNTSECVGDIEMIAREKSTDYKFIGCLGLLFQMLSSDGADCYSALGHLNGGMGFGADSAYKVLKPCKTAKEAIQETVNVFAELLPYGVQYTTHKGDELDVDTMTYMNTYFRVSYMLRSLDDPMDFYKLCKAFKVDTSKVIGNNKLTPPKRVYVGNESHVEELQTLIKDILDNNVKGLKSKKKTDQAPMIDAIKEKLESINFESHYDMVQEEK